MSIVTVLLAHFYFSENIVIIFVDNDILELNALPQIQIKEE